MFETEARFGSSRVGIVWNYGFSDFYVTASNTFRRLEISTKDMTRNVSFDRRPSEITLEIHTPKILLL